MSYESDDIERDDSILETMEDISHYTRCIPYIESDYNDLWFSPDFLLAIRRGTVVDHALLLACKESFRKFINKIISLLFRSIYGCPR